VTPQRSFTTRLTVVLALLLITFGAFVAMLSRHVVRQYQDEELQRVSYGLARHVIEHWPEITVITDRDAADQAAREALLSMLMAVNPGVQVYVLDADGRVAAYLGEPGMVRQDYVDLGPVRRFLTGDSLPLRGTDPMGTVTPRLFSAAMFPARVGDTRPPGYLYIVLDGVARDQVAAQLSNRRVWQGAAMAVSAGLFATLLIGLFAFWRMTIPLNRLARRMHDYSRRAGSENSGAAANAAMGDEVQAIEAAFDEMTVRIEGQAAREQQLADAHRETMVSVAHDLRTPLTALHGHLEALSGPLSQPAEARNRILATALAQSDKVRRLSQQLFELAALQSSDQVLHRERFCLDELVADAVQKFEFADEHALVKLAGPPPGRLELVGDLHLIERALTNLIDNALRHTQSAAPVYVSLRSEGRLAEILVEDSGPGLPAELLMRLESGQSLRDPPIKRSSGGIGGLGLAIAQRVAKLHGGSLRPQPAPGGGTRLCMALPLAD